MACCTLARGAPVSQHTSAVHQTVIVVAEAARYIGVSAGQREGAPGFVVEDAGGPVAGVMARGAVDRLGAALELAGVDIFMTPGTAFGCGLKWNLAKKGRSGGGRTVAIQASEHAVRAVEREGSGGVIEDS